jgi:hypothetical protein
MLLKIVHRGGLRPDSQTVNGHHFTAVCQVHDGGSDAKKIALVRMHDVQGQADCHPSINRIAATPEDVEPGHGGSRMAGDDDTIGALDERA